MGFFQHISQQFGLSSTQQLKLWINNNRKIAAAINRRNFLLRCRSKGVIPKHIEDTLKSIKYLLTYSCPQTNTIQKVTQRIGQKLISVEISNTIIQVNHLQKIIANNKRTIITVLPYYIYQPFFSKQNQAYDKHFKLIKNNHMKKFDRLVQNQISPIQISDKWFVNLTNTHIPNHIKQILALDPKFSLPTIKNNTNIGTILSCFENILTYTHNQTPEYYRTRFTNIISNYLHHNKQNSKHNIINTSYMEAKKFLSSNPQLILTKSDKGNCTVLMTQQEYDTKANTILQDTTYYQQLPRNPTNTIQTQTNQIISKLLNTNAINQTQAKELHIYNGISPKFFGQPKFHKPGNPLRPVISTIGSPTYKLSKFMAHILSKAYNSDNSYYIKDSFEFTNFIQNKSIPNNYVIISLDVVSLFNNIPHQMAIQTINSKWNNISQHCKLTQRQFINIIKFLFNSSYFTYKNNFYKQTLGTPMGSTISSIIAQYVMDHILDNLIPLLPFELPFIKKFVDDIITAVPADQTQTILNIFNSYNNNIQFTIEIEQQYSIPFLDTKVIHMSNNSLITDWYQKNISSGRYIHYQSNLPIYIKTNFIKSMSKRIIMLSHPQFHKQNLLKFQILLQSNGYPLTIIHKYISNTISSPLSNNHHNTPTDQQSIKKYVPFPYIPEISHKIALLLKNEPISLTHKPLLKIKSLHAKIKDPTPTLECSNIIYKIDCGQCNKHYIGQTSQYLKSRIALHKSDTRLRPERCALANHSKTNNHNFKFDNPKILHNETNYTKRIFLEMYYIHLNQKNTINNRQDTNNLDKIYHQFIHTQNTTPNT